MVIARIKAEQSVDSLAQARLREWKASQHAKISTQELDEANATIKLLSRTTTSWYTTYRRDL